MEESQYSPGLRGAFGAARIGRDLSLFGPDGTFHP